MSGLSACIAGVGVLGPGLADWPACAAVLTGARPYRGAPTELPPPGVLPPAERRRAGRVVRLALAIGGEAVTHARADARSLPSVFSSSGGDGDNCHEICLALAGRERLISPTRFHNSVHNAAAGYWGIAHGCAEASITVCAYDASFAAGLLEALAQIARDGRAVLLLAYDADYPPPLRQHRGIADAFGVALVLAPSGSPGALARLEVAPAQQSATRLDDAQLEALRLSIPAARSLPLLQCLAQSRGGTVMLDYLEPARLAVEILP
ncbi:MAG TPA: beta-ketoacyl synthase chain length factor [Steroidobacteraceae bacterium]